MIERAATQLAAHFNSEAIALTIRSALHGPQLSALQEALVRAGQRTSEAVTQLHLPHIPSREEFSAQARAMFARTPSLDEIVDRAYLLLLSSVGAHLAAAMETSA